MAAKRPKARTRSRLRPSLTVVVGSMRCPLLDRPWQSQDGSIRPGMVSPLAGEERPSPFRARAQRRTAELASAERMLSLGSFRARVSDRGAELELFGLFDPPLEVIAMHGNPVVIEGNSMLRPVVGADAVPVALPLEELASDAMAADRGAFVPNPRIVVGIEDWIMLFEHGAFFLSLC